MTTRDTPGLASGRALIHEDRRTARASRVEDVELMVRSGEGAAAIATRLGVRPASLHRLLTRVGRTDLWRAARNAEGASGVRGDQRLLA